LIKVNYLTRKTCFFGTEGYLATFTREDELFLPATVPPEDNDPMDQDDLGDGDGNTEDIEREALSKKK